MSASFAQARRGRRAALGAFAGCGVVAILIASCVSYDANEEDEVGPLRDDFAAVGEMLGARCGSLDCHGAPGRSMRIYHHFGLRLGADDVPGGDATRDEEHDASFLSVTGLEPDAIADVLAHRGEGMEELVLYGKAYGLMKHKGGAVIAPGTKADRCLVSWLAGTVDVPACEEAGTFARPAR